MNLSKSFTNKCNHPSAEKWASEGISAAKFNATHVHIETVLAHPDFGDAIGSPAEYTRQNIFYSIKAGATFVTIFKNRDGKWKKGKPLKIVVVDGKEYLKTVTDKKNSDTLDQLPEY